VKQQDPDLVLYARQGCARCEEAANVLQQQGLHPRTIDIDQDPQLREKYDCCVPVVLIDGKVRFRGRVNPVLLKRALRSRS
jgi:glutaredoxin